MRGHALKKGGRKETEGGKGGEEEPRSGAAERWEGMGAINQGLILLRRMKC